MALEAEPGEEPNPSPVDLRALPTASMGFILTPVRSHGETHQPQPEPQRRAGSDPAAGARAEPSPPREGPVPPLHLQADTVRDIVVFFFSSSVSSLSSILHKRKVSPSAAQVIARTHKEMGKCQALNIYYSDDAFYSIQWVWMFYKQRLNCHKEFLSPLF